MVVVYVLVLVYFLFCFDGYDVIRCGVVRPAVYLGTLALFSFYGYDVI